MQSRDRALLEGAQIEGIDAEGFIDVAHEVRGGGVGDCEVLEEKPGGRRSGGVGLQHTGVEEIVEEAAREAVEGEEEGFEKGGAEGEGAAVVAEEVFGERDGFGDWVGEGFDGLLDVQVEPGVFGGAEVADWGAGFGGCRLGGRLLWRLGLRRRGFRRCSRYRGLRLSVKGLLWLRTCWRWDSRLFRRILRPLVVGARKGLGCRGFQVLLLRHDIGQASRLQKKLRYRRWQGPFR
jgi:hypothetical protein